MDIILKLPDVLQNIIFLYTAYDRYDVKNSKFKMFYAPITLNKKTYIPRHINAEYYIKLFYRYKGFVQSVKTYNHIKWTNAIKQIKKNEAYSIHLFLYNIFKRKRHFVVSWNVARNIYEELLDFKYINKTKYVSLERMTYINFEKLKLYMKSGILQPHITYSYYELIKEI